MRYPWRLSGKLQGIPEKPKGHKQAYPMHMLRKYVKTTKGNYV